MFRKGLAVKIEAVQVLVEVRGEKYVLAND